MLAKLKLPENTVKAVRHTRMDGRLLGPDTRREHVGNGNDVCVGIDLTKESENQYKLVIWIVESDYHVGWTILTLMQTGEIIRGSVCQHGLVLNVSQDWVNDLLDDLTNDITTWDEIVQ